MCFHKQAEEIYLNLSGSIREQFLETAQHIQLHTLGSDVQAMHVIVHIDSVFVA